jgi:hypothetical protein
MRRSHANEPVLITSAPESNDDEFERRRRKYAIMMAGRALCVIAAASTYRVSLWLAMAFVVAGAILPWCAVIIANDGPAKKRGRTAPHGEFSNEKGLPAGDDGRTVDQ